MKFQPEHEGAIAVTAYGPHWIAVNGERHDQSLFISHDGTVQPWFCQSFDELTASHLENLSAHSIDILLMGCGSTQQFVPLQWLIPLSQRGIGLESMDTPAACRTFNILASEGRQVSAVLLIA